MKLPQAAVSIHPRKLSSLKKQAKEKGISLSKLLNQRIFRPDDPENTGVK